MAAESTVDWLKRPTGTVYSFPLPVAGSTRISTMPVPAATAGPRLSIRTTRTTRARGTSTSVLAMWTVATTTVATGSLSVPFQNNSRARFC